MKILVLESFRLHGLAMCLNNSHRSDLAAVHIELLCTYRYIVTLMGAYTIKSCVWLTFFKYIINADKLQEFFILV